jgi:long-chain acyl-CoA synthetase
MLQTLFEKIEDHSKPFIVTASGNLSLKTLADFREVSLNQIQAGDIVALVGDFDDISIKSLFQLIERKAIVAPLSENALSNIDFYLREIGAKWILHAGILKDVGYNIANINIDFLRKENKSGLILFTTGTTNKPKAILHDFDKFLSRYSTPRPALSTIGFLLFDHVGGLNTLFHMLFNNGTFYSVLDRSPNSIIRKINDYKVELLPTTPTFLRMLRFSDLLSEKLLDSLKVITYGTEMMDKPTLEYFCNKLQNVDFRQTYGMSELGILRIKSFSRESLFMKIGGEGIKTRTTENELEIFSENRMLGYINHPSPFDSHGWFKTGDLVETQNEFMRIVGRKNDIINVGGLKFMASDIEEVVMKIPGIKLVKVMAQKNPITGSHVEIIIEPSESVDLSVFDVKEYLRNRLPSHMQPRKISIGSVEVSHRMKRQ